MRQGPKLGLLPLYLELYDRVLPEQREAFAPFLEDLVGLFQERGVAVSLESIVRTEDEVQAAVNRLEQAGVDLLVTVHLAYSPSLESIGPLLRTRLPLLLLDTTMDAAFDPSTSPDRISYNHGIHGVQDLASVLLRNRRPYQVVVGHYESQEFQDRAISFTKAAAAAGALRGMKVLRIGPSFTGMGDFFVEAPVLSRQLGVEVVQIDTTPVAEAAAKLSEQEILQEIEADEQRYTIEASAEVHRRSVQAGLALRRVVDANGCAACSFNFLAFEQNTGPLSTVPFLGASKLMADGFGYAGEGDVLTAALVGALSRSYLVNFTEMFCPDWTGNSIFLSHMGEFNPACAEGKPVLVEKPFPFTPAQNPGIVVGAMREGPAVLVNLAPSPEDSFRLLAAPVEVLPEAQNPAMQQIVRGWFRAGGTVENFLQWYSENGGTHHCALVYGVDIQDMIQFAFYCGIPCVVPPAE